jgi:hypothetical protein
MQPSPTQPPSSLTDASALLADWGRCPRGQLLAMAVECVAIATTDGARAQPYLLAARQMADLFVALSPAEARRQQVAAARVPVSVGLGRIVALYHRSPTLYQIC